MTTGCFLETRIVGLLPTRHRADGVHLALAVLAKRVLTHSALFEICKPGKYASYGDHIWRFVRPIRDRLPLKRGNFSTRFLNEPCDVGVVEAILDKPVNSSERGASKGCASVGALSVSSCDNCLLNINARTRL